MTDLTIVRRSLSARRFSTATTALTVAVAVALMLVLLSMRDSGRRAFERGSGNMHLLVSADLSPLVSVLNGVFYARAPARALSWVQFQRLAADPRLAYAIPVQQGDSYRGFPVTGTTRDFFEKFSPDPAFDPTPAPRTSGMSPAWPIADGRVFARPFEIVAGYRAWREAGLKVGDHIHLSHGVSGAAAEHVHEGQEFRVVGLLGPTGTPHDRALFTDLESAWIVHAMEARERAEQAETGRGAPAADAPAGDREAHDEHPALLPEDLTDQERLITGVYMRGVTREGRAASAVVPSLAAELRRDPRLTVAVPSDEVARLFRIVGQIDRILVAMAGVVLVSSGISIMLALYNSMEQRRRQVAVLRVLGCSAARIVRLVLLEAAAIGAMGGLGGLALALAGAHLVAAALRQRLGLVVDPDLPGAVITGVVAGAMALGAIAGIVPAALAYRTPVAKNLRPMG